MLKGKNKAKKVCEQYILAYLGKGDNYHLRGWRIWVLDQYKDPCIIMLLIYDTKSYFLIATFTTG
jgi:hypothetical protein